MNNLTFQTIDVIAVRLALEHLNPGKDLLNKTEGRKEWLKKVEAYQGIIERILATKREHISETVYGPTCHRELQELRLIEHVIFQVMILKLYFLFREY